MKFNKQKFFIALICTLVGWGVGFHMGKKKAEEEFARRGPHFGISQFLDFPFFGTMDESQEEPDGGGKSSSIWERFFGHSQKNQKDQPEEEPQDSLLDHPFSMFGKRSGQPSIQMREDSQFVYMDLDLSSFDKNSLSARVEGDQVVIEGNQKSEDQGGSVSSHFYQSFPAPAGTDPGKVDMAHENNKLVLKFPKVNK